MSTIDGESFEAAISDTLKGRTPKEPVVNEDIEAAWEELTEAEQQSFRRSAEVWWPPEVPTRLPGEARATHALRTEAAEADRQTMLDKDQVKAFRKARQPSKLQNVVDAMGAGSAERNEARRQAAEAKAQEQEQLLDAQRKRARREGGSGLGGGWSQV